MYQQSDAFDRAISHALNCTVEIRNNGGVGAGCIIHKDGLVITGRHVVNHPDNNSAREVQVVMCPATDNERVLRGTVFYSHRSLDLALIWLEEKGPFPALPIGDPKKVKHAQTVYALGSPGGLANTLSKGIISNPKARFRGVECIQTDAAIDHGNSGGPLINTSGELLAINLWGLGQMDAAKFAVPVDYLGEVIQQAIKFGKKKMLDAYYCLVCGNNDPKPNKKFCRSCGSEFSSSEKHALSPKKKPKEAPGLNQATLDQIMQIFKDFEAIPVKVEKFWVKRAIYNGQEGFAAVVKSVDDDFTIVASMPVMVMPLYGRTLNFAEVMGLALSIGEIPGSKFVLQDKTLKMLYCASFNKVDESNAYLALDELIEAFAAVSESLHKAFELMFGGEVTGGTKKPPEEYPEPELPNIRMTPKEMEIIHWVLKSCPPIAQAIFKLLLEKWVKAGYVIGITGQSIVLDAPYGDRTFRLAMLFPPFREPLPSIGLFWEKLKFYQAIPHTAIQRYQKALEKTFTFKHITQSAAYIEVDENVDAKAISNLVKSMKELAESVDHAKVEPPVPSKPVTPQNIQVTLDSCGENPRGIFQMLVDGWNAAGCTVQCASPGRIYLKMKTRAHTIGRDAQLARNFNLAVLAAPKGKSRENIQVTFGLADQKSVAAYLDCIPEEVKEFEKTISALPGFEQKGTITRLWISDDFKEKHAKILMKSMLALKFSEEKSN